MARPASAAQQQQQPGWRRAMAGSAAIALMAPPFAQLITPLIA
jgi:hypothetical protein